MSKPRSYAVTALDGEPAGRVTPTIRKVSAEEMSPACLQGRGRAGVFGTIIKYGAMTARKGRGEGPGRFDLTVPAGRHAWVVNHGTWTDTYLTRREARDARARFLSPVEAKEKNDG